MSNAVVTDWPSGSANTGWPQEPTGMLLPGRVEGWPAGTQRAANAAERLLSQAVAWWDVGQYRDGDRFLRNRGTGGELLDLRLGSALAPNSNDPHYLAPEERSYAYLPGATGNSLSVPDEAALQITGDMTLIACVALADWTPSASQYLVTKFGGANSNRNYAFQVMSTGALRLTFADGSTTFFRTSTATLPIADGDLAWVACTVDADNGASGYDVRFFYSLTGADSVPASWTQLGNAVTTAGAFSPATAATTLHVGSSAETTPTPMAGRVYRTRVCNDIGAGGVPGANAVLDIDCDAITSGSATSFTAVTNQTVTINRSTSGRKSVAVPSRSKGGAPLMLLGTDDYLQCVNNWQHGLLNFGQGDSFTVTIAHRQWNNALNSGLIVKRTITGADTSPGWYLATYTQSGGVNRVGAGLGDGTFAVGGAVFPATTGWTNGVLSLHACVVDRASNSLSMALNGGPATNIAVSSVGSVITSNVIRIGATTPTIGNYATMEFYGAAIFRRALSPDEIKTLSDYMTARIA